MNTFFRFVLLSLIALDAFPSPRVSAQKLPETTRLLRFPTTNGKQIDFCYAGELYTVGKNAGAARRFTSVPRHSWMRRHWRDVSELAVAVRESHKRGVHA